MSPRVWWSLVILAIVIVAGCAGDGPPPPTRVALDIAASADLNPDPDGRPSPVVFRLYELKTPSTFVNADFFALYDQPDMALGAELQGREEMLIKPGESRNVEFSLAEETRHIGLLAAFRNLDRAVWRALLAVPPHETTPITVDLGSEAISARVSDG